MKKYSFVKFFVVFLLYSTTFSQEKATVSSKSSVIQRWGVSTSWLIQNSAFREFSSYQMNNVWYAQGINAWEIGNAYTGLAFGFSYDITFKRVFMFRIQGLLESAGWISGVIDIGTGIRIPVSRKGIYFSLEVYLSINQTGGKISRIAPPSLSQPDTLNFYMGLFGFKSRVAVEFAVSKKFFITPFLSYASYPWKASSLRSDVLVNGSKSTIIDSMQIGIEFGSKF
ncbi:MAG: hypothetical protein ACRCTQ_05225 [Brevinemataceae bacterium]